MAGLNWASRIKRLNWALRELMVYKNPSFERTVGAVKCIESFENYVKNHSEVCSKEEAEKIIEDLKLEIQATPIPTRSVRRRGWK
jgi:hypothetical protein